MYRHQDIKLCSLFGIDGGRNRVGNRLKKGAREEVKKRDAMHLNKQINALQFKTLVTCY